MRKKLLFKINNEVVIEETMELYLDQIDKLKRIIAEECGCCIDDIDVEVIVEHSKQELSNLDVNEHGMFFWNESDAVILGGIGCEIEFGSDEYLDAISDGTILDKIYFM
jgi:hypothetical protein